MIHREIITDKIKTLIDEVEDCWLYLDNYEQALGYKLALEDLLKFIDSISEDDQSEQTNRIQVMINDIKFPVDNTSKDYKTRELHLKDEAEGCEQTDREVLGLCKSWFEDIMERCDRLTSGNVSHNGRAIHGVAKSCVEYIEEHLNNKK